MYFFNGPSRYANYLQLVISLFFNVYISPKHCKYVIVPNISYGTWNLPSVTFFSNKHDYTINKV